MRDVQQAEGGNGVSSATALRSTVENNVCRDLYLDLLKKSISDTLYKAEPDVDRETLEKYVSGFISHYINGRAVTMLPRRRLDHLQTCVAEIERNHIPGDLIETGVWRGGATILMRALLRVYGNQERTVWVADSFEGLPEPDASRFPKEAKVFHGPTIQRGYKKMAATLEEVRANFEAYGLLDQQVRFLKGWFKDTLPGLPVTRLALMRLDGDYYEGTMDALLNLYDKLSVGGIVIIDDYGEDLWTECRQAVDRFRAEQGIVDPLIAVDSKCFWWRRTARD